MKLLTAALVIAGISPFATGPNAQDKKPATAKGTYLQKIGLSATMGLGIKVDPVPYRQ